MSLHLARGSLVESCATPVILATGVQAGFVDPGACPGGGAPLIKYVAAVAGDEVDEDARAVRVNDAALPLSQPLRVHDQRVRWTPRRSRLANGQIWLYGSHPLSWDSRYFGAVPVASVRAVLVPLWLPSGALAHAIGVVWGACPRGARQC